METTSPLIRVLLVDDHTVVRRGLRRVLEATNQICIVGEVNDGNEAVSWALTLSPDVVLMDIGLPGINGIEATRRILGAVPSVRVLMLSMYGDAQYVEQSRAAGASGYLLKDVDHEDLVAAILAVAQGQQAFCYQPLAGSVGAAAGPDVLSTREREVLAAIAAGASNHSVAERLEISTNTVEAHRKRIIEKLDLHSTAELVRYAVRHRLVEG